MRSIWKGCALAGLVALGAGVAGPATPASAAAMQAGTRGVASVVIQGRIVEVEFHLQRTHPGAWTSGGLAAATRVFTRDPRGLPTDLRPLFENVIHQNVLIWSTPMAPVPTFAWDPHTMLLASVNRGPDLPVGNNAAAVLWLADSRQAYRVFCLTVPVEGAQ